MADDILERIQTVDLAEIPSLLAEASDEIKRLRAENREMRDAIMLCSGSCGVGKDWLWEKPGSVSAPPSEDS